MVRPLITQKNKKKKKRLKKSRAGMVIGESMLPRVWNAGGILGFAPGASVTLQWRAKHKNALATFTFQTKRVDQASFSQGTTPVGLVGNISTVQGAAARRPQGRHLRVFRVVTALGG
jgi:hypothetical protein